MAKNWRSSQIGLAELSLTTTYTWGLKISFLPDYLRVRTEANPPIQEC